MTDAEFLTGIEQMIADAGEMGLCKLPFEIIRDRVAELIKERDALKAYRESAKVIPYRLYAGKCPRCGVVFLDDSTAYCGNCGQRIIFEQKGRTQP